MRQKNKTTLEFEELIDTLWNVKAMLQVAATSAYKRINRYTVECKAGRALFANQLNRELIDTLWNVKQFDFNTVRKIAMN